MGRNESHDSRLTYKTDDTVIYFQEYIQNQNNENLSEENSVNSYKNSTTSLYNEENLNSRKSDFEFPPITSRLWNLWINANKRRPELIERGLRVISMFKDFEIHLMDQISENESCSSEKLRRISSNSSIFYLRPQKDEMNQFCWEIPHVDGVECSKMSLQEACELHRASFVRNSQQRQQILKQFKKQVKNDQTTSKSTTQNVSIEQNSRLSLPKRRRMSKAEIKEQNARIYERLPEVVERKKELVRSEFYSRNRQQVQLFNQKILARLFSRGPKYCPNSRYKYVVMKKSEVS
ncbi:uncharacterized protein LOC115228357 isoform X2 [Octopus sinensis]|uniref:Uncharacterized protein LOC115228357 isoform X2 n=1 Tax=Octopus sinensis TaxID=2607531 RepID=A0A6P7TZX4_9MOLL|nr:uncharacterized protein LOC115228357 isoform X2 [Octopus sinensis]